MKEGKQQELKRKHTEKVATLNQIQHKVAKE